MLSGSMSSLANLPASSGVSSSGSVLSIPSFYNKRLKSDKKLRVPFKKETPMSRQAVWKQTDEGTGGRWTG